MEYKVLLFDLDGTITDSAEGILNSIRYALNKQQLPMLTDDELQSFIGPPLREQFCVKCNLADEEGTKMVELYREYYQKKGILENRVYDGIIPMLEELQKTGYRLAIATAKPEKYAKIIAEHFGFAKYFECIVGACMDGSRTDKHAVIEYALEQLSVLDRTTVVMVGDRSHDMIGAQKSGIHSLGVLYGYGSEKELMEAGAEKIVSTPEQIVKTFCDYL